jgi:uncharacterized peroxidase-related enzyme
VSYLDNPGVTEETGETRRIYDKEIAGHGYLPNFTRAFGLRPEVYLVWARLNATIRSGMDSRRYEVATLAAARRLRSSYCSLAHGQMLQRFHDEPTMRAMATDHHQAGLDPVDVAVMDFADKATRDAAGITAHDIDTLRRHGLSEEDIFQVVLAVAARCFFATVLDAVGAEPDPVYRDRIEPELRELLTVGRPIADVPAAATA